MNSYQQKKRANNLWNVICKDIKKKQNKHENVTLQKKPSTYKIRFFN